MAIVAGVSPLHYRHINSYLLLCGPGIDQKSRSERNNTFALLVVDCEELCYRRVLFPEKIKKQKKKDNTWPQHLKEECKKEK